MPLITTYLGQCERCRRFLFRNGSEAQKPCPRCGSNKISNEGSITFEFESQSEPESAEVTSSPEVVNGV